MLFLGEWSVDAWRVGVEWVPPEPETFPAFPPDRRIVVDPGIYAMQKMLGVS